MAKHKQVDGQLSFADYLLGREDSAPEQAKTCGESAADNAPAVNDDDARFEAEFAKLQALFDSVRTEEFDAMQFLSPIANAVKTAIEEQIPFSQALPVHCSRPSAQKILQAFPKDKQEKLFAIIAGMHDDLS